MSSTLQSLILQSKHFSWPEARGRGRSFRQGKGEPTGLMSGWIWVQVDPADGYHRQPKHGKAQIQERLNAHAGRKFPQWQVMGAKTDVSRVALGQRTSHWEIFFFFFEILRFGRLSMRPRQWHLRIGSFCPRVPRPQDPNQQVRVDGWWWLVTSCFV